MSMRLIRLELSKILSQKVVYIAFAAFAFLYGLQFFSDLRWDGEINTLRQAYRQYGGELTVEKMQWADEVIEQFQLEAARLQEVGEHRQLITEQPIYAQSRVAYDIRNAVRQTREAVNPPHYVLYQEGWRNILGYMEHLGYFFAAGLSIIGLAAIFSNEYTSRMDSLLFSSRHGRQKAVTAKIIASAIYCLTVVAGFSIIVLLLNGIIYGVHGWNLDLVNITSFYSTTSFSGAIWRFYLIQQGYAVLGCTALGMLVAWISSLTRHALLPAFVGGTVFMLAAILPFVQMPYQLFEVILFVFRYVEFLQLSSLAGNRYYTIWGTLVLYRHGLIGVILAYIFVPTALIYYNIRNRQVM